MDCFGAGSSKQIENNSEDVDDDVLFTRGSGICPKIVSALFEYAKIVNINEDKIRAMRSDLHEMRRKCAVHVSPSEDAGPSSFEILTGCVPPSSSPWSRTCCLCRVELGLVVNRGAVCQSCRKRVCRQCREHSTVLQQKPTDVQWVCTLCYKQAELQRATGDWMQEYAKNPGQKFFISAADLIKTTIQRSWTISETTCNWRSKKKHFSTVPLHKRHNSLPRGQDLSAYPSFKRRGEDKTNMDKKPLSPKSSSYEKVLNEMQDPGGTPCLDSAQMAVDIENVGGSIDQVDRITPKNDENKEIRISENSVSVSLSEASDIDEAMKRKRTTSMTVEDVQINDGDEQKIISDEVGEKRTRTASSTAELVEHTSNDDYRLVYISSDSCCSSREDEEDTESTASSSTNAHTSSFDECDWDYFEPSVAADKGATTTMKRRRQNANLNTENTNRYRQEQSEILSKPDPLPTENATAVWHAPTCTSCGAVASTSSATTHQPSLRLQYVPVPVLVPVPFPVPYNNNNIDQLNCTQLGQPNNGLQLGGFGLETLSNVIFQAGIQDDPLRLRLIQQRLMAAMTSIASTQQPITVTTHQSITENGQHANGANERNQELLLNQIETNNVGEENKMVDSNQEDDDDNSSDTSDSDTDTDDTGTVADLNKTKFNKVFVVNSDENSPSSSSSSSSDLGDDSEVSENSDDSSDNDSESEPNDIILNYMRPIDENNDKNGSDDEEAEEEDGIVLLKHVNFDQNETPNQLEDQNIPPSKKNDESTQQNSEILTPSGKNSGDVIGQSKSATNINQVQVQVQQKEMNKSGEKVPNIQCSKKISYQDKDAKFLLKLAPMHLESVKDVSNPNKEIGAEPRSQDFETYEPQVISDNNEKVSKETQQNPNKSKTKRGKKNSSSPSIWKVESETENSNSCGNSETIVQFTEPQVHCDKSSDDNQVKNAPKFKNLNLESIGVEIKKKESKVSDTTEQKPDNSDSAHLLEKTDEKTENSCGNSETIVQCTEPQVHCDKSSDDNYHQVKQSAPKFKNLNPESINVEIKKKESKVSDNIEQISDNSDGVHLLEKTTDESEKSEAASATSTGKKSVMGNLKEVVDVSSSGNKNHSKVEKSDKSSDDNQVKQSAPKFENLNLELISMVSDNIEEKSFKSGTENHSKVEKSDIEISLSALGVKIKKICDTTDDVVNKNGGIIQSSDMSSESKCNVARSNESVSNIALSKSGDNKTPTGINMNVGASGETKTTTPTTTNHQSTSHNEQDDVLSKTIQQRYTSLVMITQQQQQQQQRHQQKTIESQVNIITTNSTTLTIFQNENDEDDTNDNLNSVTVKHTNREAGLADYFTQLDSSKESKTPRKVLVTKTNQQQLCNNKVHQTISDSEKSDDQGVAVVTGGTLSSVVCLEDGLADDDSWVEEISYDEDDSATDDSLSSEEVNMCKPVIEGIDLRQSDHEEELRGYHRTAIDFTLHTIVEESCEESEVEQREPSTDKKKNRTSATELEKYFYFDVGDGSIPTNARVEDVFSETSSIYSESMDSLGDPNTNGNTEKQTVDDDEDVDPAELASSRLEKYFLSGFMGFQAGRRDSDGSVGSDSEGRPSPEQRRKKLLRGRNSRSQSSSLDNLLTDGVMENLTEASSLHQIGSGDTGSSDSDTQPEEGALNNFEKSDGQFDTVKRKKCKKRTNQGSSSPQENEENENEGGNKTPIVDMELASDPKKSNSRDSGFVGSTDDLINKPEPDKEVQNVEIRGSEPAEITTPKVENPNRLPPATVLTRKDSFNNWSSDEETNLMMSKMRQFFKTMIGARGTPGMKVENGEKSPMPAPRKRDKPPQLVYFENELTRLMKTVPGIRDDQVREIVEYLSSEDTWSDSYDSSDYTSSDLEGVTVVRTALREQISASCRQIIDKFETPVCDQNRELTRSPGNDEEGDRGDGGILEHPETNTNKNQNQKETAIVYQRLVASLNKMTTNSCSENGFELNSKPASPPLIAKVMQHIGTRLVALMHEVSSSGGESAHSAGSPKQRYHRRLPSSQQKSLANSTVSNNIVSSASTTTTEDEDDDRLGRREDGGMLRDPDDDVIVPYSLLPRSRSHDLLLGDARHHQHVTGTNQSSHQASAGRGSSCDVTIDGREGDASDYERFSWRGSFESALMASTDSRQRLSTIGSDVSSGTTSSAVAAAVAAKRRSAGDLLFSPRFGQSREHLDRVRSCGSIGGATGVITAGSSGGDDPSRPWVVGSRDRPTRRRSSVPDAAAGSGDSADGEDEDDDERIISNRSTTLPRSLQSTCGTSTTNSLPRLPTSGSASSGTGANSSPSALKAHSVHHFLQNNVKSARYRPPGFSRTAAATLAGLGAGPKRAASAPGLQQPPRRRRSQQSNTSSQDDLNQLEISGRSSSARNSLAESAGSSPRLIGAHAHRRRSHDDENDFEHDYDESIEGERTSQSSSTIGISSPMHKSHSLSLLGARSDSMASVYSGAGDGRHGNVAVRGQVEFALQYNYKTSELEIGVRRCRDLAAVDSKRNRSDPYVKVYLLPDKSKAGKRKTKVKKHTLNPQFDETLRFQMTLDRLEQRTLWLTVWHSDMFGRNDFLGEVTMPLENFVFDDPTPKWYTLNERTEPYDCDQQSYRGDIVVGLKYVPPDERALASGGKGGRSLSRGTLHVLVKEAKNLVPGKPNGTADPFCKGYLLPDRARGNKQKTSVARRTLAPQWQHTFTYEDVTLQELAERSLELTVWDHDRLASNEFLGGVRFSLATGKHYGKPVDWIDATGKELQLWQSMLERPNLWVEGSVPLRATLDNRNAPT